MTPFEKVVRRAALAIGLHVGRFPARESLQGHLKKFFEVMGVNCILDVGAHHGEFVEEVREIGYRGRIVSFEPVRESYELIARKAAGNRRWMVRNWALGAEETEKQINVYRGGVFNSFLPSSRFGGDRFGPDLDRAATETVRIRRLDQVFAECTAGVAPLRCFLKMDTQGWDLEVLKGASGVLSSIVGLQSELAVLHCYEGMVGFTEALATYAKLGFEVTGLFPVALDTDGLRVVELDCVMVSGTCSALSSGRSTRH